MGNDGGKGSDPQRPGPVGSEAFQAKPGDVWFLVKLSDNQLQVIASDNAMSLDRLRMLLTGAMIYLQQLEASQQSKIVKPQMIIPTR